MIRAKNTGAVFRKDGNSLYLCILQLLTDTLTGRLTSEPFLANVGHLQQQATTK